MLHQKTLVCFLDRFREDRAFDIASVNEIILIVAVATVDQRLSDKSTHGKKLTFIIYFQKRRCNISSVNMIDQILAVAVAGRV